MIGSVLIRNKATLAWNLVNASPVGDFIPTLQSLDARVEIRSLSNKREVNTRDFILGYKKVDLKQGEIVTKIIIPLLSKDENVFSYSLATRKQNAISKLTMYSIYKIKNKKLLRFNLFISGLDSLSIRSLTFENLVKNLSIEDFKKLDIVKYYEAYFKAVDDKRSTKEYKEEVAKNLLIKLKEEIMTYEE